MTRDEAAGYATRQLSAWFASEDHEPYRVKYPANWWEHFKQQCFPKSLLKRYPVKMHTEYLHVSTVYPFLKTQLPLDVCGPRVCIMIQDKLIGSFLPNTPGLTAVEWQERAKLETFAERYYRAASCPRCGRYLGI